MNTANIQVFGPMDPIYYDFAFEKKWIYVWKDLDNLGRPLFQAAWTAGSAYIKSTTIV